MKETREQYILHITGAQQTYISRIKMEGEKDPASLEFWRAPITELLCLSLVISRNLSKLTIEELREFASIYSIADIAHDPKQPKQEREKALRAVSMLVEQSISRYAYLIGLTKEQITTMMNEEKQILNGTQTSIIQRDGGLIIDRPLKLRQNTREPKHMVPKGKIIPLDSYVREETPTDFARRRMQEESNLKRHLAYLLKMSYENIKEFEERYKKYSDYHNVKDITKTLNPIIRSEKNKKMQEHLFKLERYHRTISALYNTLYQILVENFANITREELTQVESLFLLYESITSGLKDCLGDLTVSTMERRRLRLQEQITKYNDYIDQISTGDEPTTKSKLS